MVYDWMEQNSIIEDEDAELQVYEMEEVYSPYLG
jgi:hypothetical protein